MDTILYRISITVETADELTDVISALKDSDLGMRALGSIEIKVL